MSLSRECLVMAKPAGARCNLRCSYCYYVGDGDPHDERNRPMSRDLLERFIVQRFAASSGPVTHFEWHGGEPTVLGLAFFATAVALQRKHLPPGRRVSNGLQTNGLLLDDEWAQFLARERFSVGLSLDGPADLHDRYRVTAVGAPTQVRVVQAFRRLKQRGVFCNVLCVLHAANTPEPERTYGFFQDLGVTHLQFLPLVGRAGSGASEAAAAAETVGEFLCRVFDRWIGADVGRIVVQTFDEALRPIHGVEHALCVHRETCGDVAVLERDGSFFACDHFVDGEHRIGNLWERDLGDLAADPRLRAFGEAKRETLPRACRECDVLRFCNGGCPKDRMLATADGEPGLNVLCAAYRRFFLHAMPELTRLSAHIKAGRRLREFRPASTHGRAPTRTRAV
jgi:uncharacterized protein